MRRCWPYLVASLLVAGCGRSPSPEPDVPPPPAVEDAGERVDTGPATAPGEDTSAPAPPDEDAGTPPVAPIVPEPPPTAWTVDLVPRPVREDAPARAFLKRVAGEGVAAHVDAESGLVWDADGTPSRVTAAALNEIAADLEAAIRGGADDARCRAGVCLVEGEGRWFIRLRRTGRAPGRVSGVLRATSGWPSVARYQAWLGEVTLAESSRAPSLIGDALSSEEGGHFERAYEKLQTALALSPDNPWPLYYMARVNVGAKRYREAYIDFRRLTEHPSAYAVALQLKLEEDEEMARFREHSAVQAVQAELQLPAPETPEGFLAWLRRFRAVETRIASVIAEGGPDAQQVQGLLETHLLDDGAVSDSRVAWTGAALVLRRNALGALEISGIEDPAAPGAARRE